MLGPSFLRQLMVLPGPHCGHNPLEFANVDTIVTVLHNTGVGESGQVIRHCPTTVIRAGA